MHGDRERCLEAGRNGDISNREKPHAVTFVSSPRTEPYGTIAVFLDCEGNRWDLLGPAT